jgi:uncharacterized protein YecE (DUF72 family)
VTGVVLKELKNLLDQFPKKLILALEFRNKSWFNDSIYSILKNFNASLVCVNNGNYTFKKTYDFFYFRYEGDRKK